MKRRAPALLAAIGIMLIGPAPAAALSPKDAQGSENTKTDQLASYCTTD